MAISANLRGSLYMAVGMAGFTLNDAITKTVTAEINFGEVIVLRGAFAIPLIVLLAIYRDALRPVRTLAIRPVAARVFGEVGGTLTFLAAISFLPLANASAIFQALPLVITVGAALIFHEPVGRRRWIAIAAGFVGVLIIIRPGFEGFNQYTLFALASVLFCALRDLATKKIPAAIPSLLITLLTTVVVSVAGAVIIVPLGGWTAPRALVVALLALAAVLLLIGYQFVIMALRSGDISAVAPFRYTALLWAIVLGYLVFTDIPDATMMIGAATIVASGLYSFYSERLRDRRAAVAQAGSLPPDGL